MAGENANYAKMYTFSTTTKVTILDPNSRKPLKCDIC
jgi:hypothetical protein